MSYEIIKSIRITENKVYINSACNNVFPRDFCEEENPCYSDLLLTEGREAVEKKILMDYFDGWFRAGRVNKYDKAVRRVELRLRKEGVDNKEILEKCRDIEFRKEFQQTLYDEMHTRVPKQPCVLEHSCGARISKIGTRRYYYDSSKPKIYPNVIEAEMDLLYTGLDKKGFKIVIL